MWCVAPLMLAFVSLSIFAWMEGGRRKNKKYSGAGGGGSGGLKGGGGGRRVSLNDARMSGRAVRLSTANDPEKYLTVGYNNTPTTFEPFKKDDRRQIWFIETAQGSTPGGTDPVKIKSAESFYLNKSSECLHYARLCSVNSRYISPTSEQGDADVVFTVSRDDNTIAFGPWHLLRNYNGQLKLDFYEWYPHQYGQADPSSEFNFIAEELD